MNKNIKITISKKALQDIEENILGKDRNEKVMKCVAKGFELLMETEAHARNP